MILKPKLQYFGHLIGRADSLEKTLMLGKIEGRRRRGQLRIRQLDSVSDSTDMNLSKLWKIVQVPASHVVGRSQQTVENSSRDGNTR